MQRLELLEAENAALLKGLCQLAARTGVSVPGCGPADGDLRLAEGATPSEGRLEMFWQGEWGTVCDDFWSTNGVTNGRVACQQLGFSDAATVLFLNDVTDGTGPIFLDNVQCLGTETRLVDCAHNPIGTHNCIHFEDVGVRCVP